jgi:hypothetical protein
MLYTFLRGRGVITDVNPVVQDACDALHCYLTLIVWFSYVMMLFRNDAVA